MGRWILDLDSGPAQENPGCAPAVLRPPIPNTWRSPCLQPMESVACAIRTIAWKRFVDVRRMDRGPLPVLASIEVIQAKLLRTSVGLWDRQLGCVPTVSGGRQLPGGGGELEI